MRNTHVLAAAVALLSAATVAFSQDPAPGPRLEAKLESAHLRHGRGEVAALAASADGKTLVSSGRPGGIRVWDLATRQLVRELEGPVEEWLALSADGRRVVALREDGSLRLQDARPGDGPRVELVEAPADKALTAVAVSRDGARVAATVGSSVKVWSMATGDEERTIAQEGAPVTALAFSSDAKQLATLTAFKLAIHDLATGKVAETRQIREEGDEHGGRHRPRALAFANGPFVRWVCCYAVYELDRREEEDLPFPIAALPYWTMSRERAITVWPDGAAFGAISHSDVVIERPGANKRHLRGNVGELTALAAIDKKTAVTGGRDGTIRIWDVEKEDELEPAAGHLGGVVGIGFATGDGDARLLASISAEAATRWDLATRKGRHLDVTRARITATAFVPRSPWVVVGELDGSARVVNAETGTMRGAVELGETVRAAGAAPDGRRLAFGLDDRSLRIHDAFDLAEVARLSGFENYFSSIAFAPDGRRIAVACSSPRIRFFAPNGRALGSVKTAASVTLLAFAPDGKTLAASHDDATVTLHDEKGAVTRTVTLEAPPSAIAFSMDGRELLVATPRMKAPASLKVVDLASGEARTVQELPGPVTALAVSGDGASVGCGHEDGTVSLWKWR